MASGLVKKVTKVYAGVGTSYPQIGTVGPEANVEIIRKEGTSSFYVIECRINETGKMAWGYVLTTAIPSNTIVGTVPKVTVKTLGNQLTHAANVYSGPGAGYMMLDTIGEDTILTAYDLTVDGYHFVQFLNSDLENTKGYVDNSCFYTSSEAKGWLKSEGKLMFGPGLTYGLMDEPVGPRESVTIISKYSSSPTNYYVEFTSHGSGKKLRGYLNAGVTPIIGTVPTAKYVKTYKIASQVPVYLGPGSEYVFADTLDVDDIIMDLGVTENGYTEMEYITDTGVKHRGYVLSSQIYPGMDINRGIIAKEEKVYAGPSTSYLLLGTAGPNEKVDIIAKEGGYYEFEFIDKSTHQTNRGYISGSNLDYITGEVPVRSTTKSYKLAKASTVYAGPAGYYKTVGNVYEEQIVTVYGTGENGYTLVEFELDGLGKVRGYLGNDRFYSSEKIMALLSADKKVYASSGAASGTVLLDTILKNTQVRIIRKEDSYYLIEYEGATLCRGYGSTSSVTCITGEVESIKTTQSNALVFASQIYTGPGAEYSQADYLEHGTIVAVCNIQEKNYTLIEYLDTAGKKHRGYLPTSNIYTSDTIAGVVEFDKAVYSGPSSSYAIIGQAEAGQKVTIINKEGGYYAIEFVDKVTGATARGYLATGYLTNIVGVPPVYKPEEAVKLTRVAQAYYGPGSNYLSARVMEADDIVTVFTNAVVTNGYAMIEYYNLEDKLTRAFIPSSSIHTESTCPVAMTTALKIVYAGPSGSAYVKLGTIESHRKVRILYKEGSYYAIEYTFATDTKPTQGYTTGSYFGMIFGEVPEKTITTTPMFAHQATVYSGPGPNYVTAGEVKEANIVLSCNLQQDGYSLMEYYADKSDKKRAFIASQQLYLDSSQVVGMVVATTNVYAGPIGSKYLPLGTIGPAQLVKIICNEKTYSLIEYKLNDVLTRAYILTTAIKDIVGTPEVKTVAEAVGMLTHQTSAYTGPGSQYEAVTSLTEGQVIGSVNEVENGYTLIEVYVAKLDKRRLYVPSGMLYQDSSQINATTCDVKKVYAYPGALTGAQIGTIPAFGKITCLHKEVMTEYNGSAYPSYITYYLVEFMDESQAKMRGYLTKNYVDFMTAELPVKKLKISSHLIHACSAYSGPSEDYKMLTTYNEGDVVEVYDDTDGAFTIVRYKDAESKYVRAYVYSSSIYDNSNEIAGIVKSQHPLYSGPNANTYTSVGTVGPQQRVTILCKENNYYEIVFTLAGGSTMVHGYIQASYVSNIYGSAPGRTVKETYQMAHASESYYGPGTTYVAGGTIVQDTIVTVLDITENGYTAVEFDLSDGKHNRVYIPSGKLYLPDKVMGYIASQSKVYGGPGSNYKLIGMAEPQFVTVICEDKGYYMIDFKPLGQTIKARGYLLKSALTKMIGTPEKMTAVTDLKLSGATMAYTGPGTDYLEAGLVDEDAIVSAFDLVESGFALVELAVTDTVQPALRAVSTFIDKEESVRAYVDSMFLKYTQSAKVAAAATVYHGPDAQIYASIGSVSQGDSVLLQGIENGWFYIAYRSAAGDKQGYIPASKIVDGQSLANSVPVRQFKGYAGCSLAVDVQVYAGPNTKYNNSGTVYANEGITVFNQGHVNGWIYVEYSTPDKTKRGFIPQSALSTLRHEGKLAQVKIENSKVYAGPDASYMQQGTVYGGENVVILNKEIATGFPAPLTTYDYIEFNAPSGRKRGYINHSELTELESTSTLDNLPAATGFAKAQGSVKVYAGPGMQYAAVGTIYQNERVRIFAAHAGDGDYSYIEYNTSSGKSKRGYVHNSEMTRTTVSLQTIMTPSQVTQGSYGQSGNGRPLNYYKIGSGPNILAAVFAVHGYEDAWAADGEELYKIASHLISELAGDAAKGLINDWTVYIIPTANPDGILDGWTNNGPGRTTVSKGIDLNRSFPYKFKVNLADKRNYTGNFPLGAPEAQALEQQLKQWQPQEGTGEMILLDVHGWLNQTIGHGVVAKYFNEQFGLNYTFFNPYSGNGYLSFWGKSLKPNMHAALIELPRPASSQAILDQDFAGKFTTATRELLKNSLAEINKPIPVESIIIEEPRKTQMQLGQTLTLTAVITPSDANVSLTWTSSDPTIATVEGLSYSEGIATAKVTANQTKGGSITIACQTTDGGKMDTIKLKVEIPATKITITAAPLTIDQNKILSISKDQEVQLGVTFEPENTTTTLADINWYALDPEVLYISPEGKIRPIAQRGSTYISAMVHGSSTNDQVIVVIEDVVVPVNSVTINEQTISIKDGETKDLTCTVLPETATNKQVRWSSSDTGKVVVNRYTGKITAKTTGSATITCTTRDGAKTATTQVTVVKEPVTEIILNETKLVLAKNGGNAVLWATIKPGNATNQELTWVSDSNLVSVQAIDAKSALVTAGSTVGKATISCFVAGEKKPDGSGDITASAEITVEIPAKAVSIKVPEGKNNFVVAMKSGEKVQLKAEVTPEDATNKEIIWAVTLGEKVAKISETGLVEALGSGTAIVQAKIKDTYIIDMIMINVEKPEIALQSITLTPDKLVFADKTVRPEEVRVSFTPGNATNQVAHWSSSNENVVKVYTKVEPWGTVGAIVKPIGHGEATITCTPASNADLKKTIAVKVDKIKAESIEIQNSSSTVGVITVEKDAQVWIEAVIKPDNSDEQAVTWELAAQTNLLLTAQLCKVGPDIFNPEISWVQQVDRQRPNVKLLGNAVGTTTLTATITNDNEEKIKDTITIKVVEKGELPPKPTPDEDAVLTINVPENPMSAGKNFTAAFNPSSAAEPVTWTSDNMQIAAINPQTGEVIGATDGETTIRATTESGLSASVKVKFVKAQSGGDNLPTVEGHINGNATIYFGPDATTYVLLGSAENQEVDILHQEGEWYFVQLQLLKESGQPLARGYVEKSKVEVPSGENVSQKTLIGKAGYATRTQAYCGPHHNYKPASTGASVGTYESITVFDLKEQQQGDVEYTFIEYNVQGKKKRVYVTTESLNLDNVHYIQYEMVKGTVYDGWSITQGFNDKTTKRKGHLGHDMTHTERKIYPIFAGTVVFRDWNNDNGNCIVLKHTIDGTVFYSCYGHMKGFEISTSVKEVQTDTLLGIMGHTGEGLNPDAAHLHLGVFTNNSGSAIGGGFSGYSHDDHDVPFEQSGQKSGRTPYDYNGYYFDGPRAGNKVFYDPMAVIYTNGGVIKRHPA